MGEREREMVAAGKRAQASCWRAVQVRPAAEAKVVEALSERYGVHAYVPVERVWRGEGARKVATSRPLFRGYVFAQLPDERVHLVHEVDGATRLFTLAGRPVRIDPVFIDRFQRAEALGAWDKTLPPAARPRPKRGDMVEVLSGPFGGFIGAVERMKGERRLVVLVALFGRMSEVDVALEEVVAKAA